jgi:hypothetical protein
MRKGGRFVASYDGQKTLYKLTFDREEVLFLYDSLRALYAGVLENNENTEKEYRLYRALDDTLGFAARDEYTDDLPSTFTSN